MSAAATLPAAALARIPGVWRGRLHHRQAVLPSGHAQLDAVLPGGGWPLGALSEVLTVQPGFGLELLLPALRQKTAAGFCTALVAPPFVPYAPGLIAEQLQLSRVLWVQPETDADGLWAAEQLTRSGALPLVVAWSAADDETALRRLQLAAETAAAVLVLFRPAATRLSTSPAALRLVARSRSRGVALEILKNRGGRSGQQLQLPVCRRATA